MCIDKVWCDICHKEIDEGGDEKWAVCDASLRREIAYTVHSSCGLNWCGECRTKAGWHNVEELCPRCAPIIVPRNLVG